MNKYDIIGEIFESNYDGKFEIVDYIGVRNRNHIYKIKFIDTGFEKEVRKDGIKNGNVRDDSKHTLVGFEGISKKGYPFKVIERTNKLENNSRIYKVLFPNTGYIGEYRRENVKNCNIMDPTAPTKYGIAYSDGMPTKNEDGSTIKTYGIWAAIISRCYNPNDNNYQYYGALGIRVCDEWLHYKNFLNDLPLIPGYDLWKNDTSEPALYHLDKDILQRGIPNNQKIYSVRTCMFVNKYDNINEIYNRFEFNELPYAVIKSKSGNYNTKILNEYNKQVHLGTYSDPIAAAVIRDWYINMHNLSNQKNFTEYPMSVPEAISYRIPAKGMIMKEMCKIVDKDK